MEPDYRELIHLRATVRMVRRMLERGDDTARILRILDMPPRRPITDS